MLFRSNLAGQLVLLFVAGIYGLGIFWLRRLANLEQPERLLGGMGRTAVQDDQSGDGESVWSPSRGGAK